MPGNTKPLTITRPQAKRLAQTLRPAAVKNMKIDLSLFGAENEECCIYPKRTLSRLSNQTNWTTRQRKAATNRGTQRPYEQHYCIDGGDDDGIALARSDVPLPGDGYGNKSTPRLQRQEAFRGPSVRRQGAFVSSDDVVENDADLYRLGLLYDGETNRGPVLSLDAIVHTEPLYTVRLSRRKQKRGKHGHNNMYSPGTPLPAIYESLEDSLYSLCPLSPTGYFSGDDDGEDWSFIPLLVPNGGSANAGDTVSVGNVTTLSTEPWVVLDGA
ncbi:uncharacterized protein PG998_005844 [Apiospora kogelbergensis]|uniref:uncharacterized protein n=1 Tax=Apiospora kogelbergensis TaxID=1337665 RepID=UPI00312E3E85